MSFRKVLLVLHKPQTQTILRYLVDFASRSPLHGLNYLARRNIHWFEFVYWIVALSLMVSCGFKSAIELVITFRSRNSAITYNVDYMQLNTFYPSITVCPQEILDPEKVKAFIRTQSFLQNENEEKQFEEFLEKLSIISGRKAPRFEVPFNMFPCDEYMETIFNLSQVYSVSIQGRPAVKVMTDVGICYTLGNFLYKEMYTQNWHDSNPFPRNTNDRFQPSSPTFNFSHSYPIEKYIQHNITGDMTIYMHSPYDLPTTWSRPAAIVNPSQTIRLIAAIKEITYHKKLLTETNVDERRCRTMTQSNLVLFPSTYSQNLCLMECRANYIAYICHCIPHFYRNTASEQSVPICNAMGLNCYAQYIRLFRNIISNSKSPVFQCECYPNCITQYVVTEVVNIDYHSNKSNVFINIEYPPLESYQRSVMYSPLDYAVTLFTVMSAFLGFSILSLCDFIYFFTVRVYWFRRGYRGSVDTQ